RAPLPSDHDDDAGGDARRPAAGARHRRRLRAATATRHRDRRRARRQSAADALHHAGRLPLPRSSATAVASPLSGVAPAASRAVGGGAPSMMRGGHRMRATLTTAALALLGGCAVGPDYVRPTVVTPPAHREIDGWKVAEPRDVTLRCAWWEAFGDTTLNGLEPRVGAANQTLVAAEATYRQASALVREARAGFFPTVTIGAGYTRSRVSSTITSGGTNANATAAALTGGVATSTTGRPSNFFQLPIDVSWTPDFWGRVRRTVESNRAAAQASAGDLETARLSLQAELAQDYFQMRTLDAQRKLLDETVAAYETSLELTRTRFRGGVASQVDIVQAETQLETTRAQAIDVGVARAQFEHAIALLTGQAA